MKWWCESNFSTAIHRKFAKYSLDATPLETPRYTTLKYPMMNTYDVSLREMEYWTSKEQKKCSGSCPPSDTMSWIRELEAAQTIDDLNTSQFFTGDQYTHFPK